MSRISDRGESCGRFVPRAGSRKIADLSDRSRVQAGPYRLRARRTASGSVEFPLRRILGRSGFSKPVVKEGVEPAGHVGIVHVAAFDLALPILRSGQGKALGGPDGPAAHHGVSDFRVELQAERARTDADRLGREIVAGGERFGARRAIESFAMPVIHVARPRHAPAVRDRVTGFCRDERVIADLGAAARMLPDGAPMCFASI